MNIDLTKLEDEVKGAIASSKFVDIEVLEFLSKDKSPSVRKNVAGNPNCTDAILRNLSKDPNKEVRINVAKNPTTSSGILKHLAEDRNNIVRFEVAKNKNTSSKTLDFLSYDRNIVIKRNVAMNKNTSPKTLENLATEQFDFAIKYFVAHNDNTPEEVKTKLKRKLPNGTWPMIPTIQMLREF